MNEMQNTDSPANNNKQSGAFVGKVIELGHITVPSGILMIIDPCFMDFWHHEKYLKRIKKYLMKGNSLNGISFLEKGFRLKGFGTSRIMTAVVAGIPGDRSYTVYGRFNIDKNEFGERLHDLYVEIEPGGNVVRSQLCGSVGVNSGTLIFACVNALKEWQPIESLDGKADISFWGKDEDKAALVLGASRFKGGRFGWQDLPMEDFVAIIDRSDAIERAREKNNWTFVSSFDPHSHFWKIGKIVEESETGAGILNLGGANVCVSYTSWGDGVFNTYVDFDQNNRLVGVRVELETEERIECYHGRRISP